MGTERAPNVLFGIIILTATLIFLGFCCVSRVCKKSALSIYYVLGDGFM